MSRPELTGLASNFYNNNEARKYDSNSRMIGIQVRNPNTSVGPIHADSGRYTRD